MRTIDFASKQHTTSPIFKKFEALKIPDIIQLETLKFIHKYEHGNLPPIFKNWYVKTSEIHNYNTRRKKNSQYYINRTSSNIAANMSVLRRGLLDWNKLTEKYKGVLCVKKFGSLIKKEIFDKY